jgi:hypothetical protein
VEEYAQACAPDCMALPCVLRVQLVETEKVFSAST